MLSLISANASELQAVEHNLTDSMITTVITAKYTKNPNLNPLKIYVTTNDGVVSLSGHVKNKEAFIEALRQAKQTRGVLSINTNELNIHPGNAALTDAYITTKVEAAILKAKVLDDESIPLVGINAKTNDGVVMLHGKVHSDKSIITLTKRISEVSGVKRVISKLKITKNIT